MENRKDEAPKIEKTDDLEISSPVEAAFNTDSFTEVEDASEKETINQSNTATEERREAISINSSLEAADVNQFEKVFTAIEEAFPKQKTTEEYAFPHPRYWLGPRFMAIWALPFVAITRATGSIRSLNPVRPYRDTEYSVKKSATIYTATKDAFENSKSIRFFGARFLTVWVLPMAITGTVMEFLFVSPLMGVKPFG